ncbi:MAG: 3-deoxy-7-phosphoheptulonate synthase [Flavobacteriales bacterium]|nr:3-deoxy-7-phosphoheptulonate synthase [Flavobacteriales bacterium]MCB9449059.1 3-deoxy-7-phosphoheptulonate synthase [Flavobacteriales bacterium]
MIIQLKENITPAQREALNAKIAEIGYKPTEVKTQRGTYLVCIGKKEFDIRIVGAMAGVKDLHRVSDAYKLVSRKWKVEPTVIDLGDGVKIGGGDFAMMAGPCSIESEEQVEKIVQHLVANGIRIMRGGVYKPRSSPYTFRGMGIEGLKMWHGIASKHGIKIITEVMQVSQVEDMYPYIDIYQVGARNSQNFNLLDALGEVDKPVLIKRGMSGTIDELLQSAEYIFSNGNERLLLCERGIRTFENAYRNTFDINAIPVLKEKSHLPVIADPSHGVGVRAYVPSIALAGVAAGADGVIYEVHEKPEEAMSDGQQTLNFSESEKLIGAMRKMEGLVCGL